MLVAVVDTGVEFRHPHVRRMPRGCAVRVVDGKTEVVEGDFADPVGHGTCVAALVLHLAPDVELDAIRAVGPDMLAYGDVLAAAMEVAANRYADIVLMSVGTADLRFAWRLSDAVGVASRAGAKVVAAAPEGKKRMMPASLPGVIAVGAAPAGTTGIVHRAEGFPPWLAPCDARPFEGQSSNFRGPSLAAAFVAAQLARGEALP